MHNSVRSMNVLAGSLMLLQDPTSAKAEFDELRHLVDESLTEQAIEKKETILCMLRALTETNPRRRRRSSSPSAPMT
jgi:pyruvate, orthophosphate dikinase